MKATRLKFVYFWLWLWPPKDRLGPPTTDVKAFQSRSSHRRFTVRSGIVVVTLAGALSACGGSQTAIRVAGVADVMTGSSHGRALGIAGAPLTHSSAHVVSATPSRGQLQGAADIAASGSGVLRRYFPQYMISAKYSQAQAVAIAQEFDIIAARNGAFTPYVSAMKAAHPSLLLVVGLNGMFDTSGGGSAYPASWYAHDAHGNRIRSRNFGFYLMDPTNPLWPVQDAKNCTALIAASKYSGCLLDTMGEAPIIPGYCTGLPIDRATGKVFTASQWITATSHVASTVKAANPTYAVLPNGLENGARYYLAGGPTKPLLVAAGMAMAEIWLRSPTVSVNQYPSVSLWQQDVNMLVDAEAHGWTIATTTKLWTRASTAQQDAWHKFTLATFLLGAGGHCAYSFSTASSSAALSATSAWDHVAIGAPTGAYSVLGGVYKRIFSNGVVVVNPGDTAVTINLGATYQNLNGTRVSSETLQPHTGDVLTG
jgi:Hypothetical glycosyl hydrolase family 15